MYKLIDVHTHLHDKAFEADRDQIIEKMKNYGVKAITVGTELRDSRLAVELADKHEHIFATIGLHPCDNVMEQFDKEAFEKLATHPKVVAIGECGLDYFYIQNFFAKDVEERGVTWSEGEEKNRQKKLFEAQIELAVHVGKPLMLHGRPSKGTMDAYEDMLEVLEDAKKKHGDELRGNAHFFVGDIDIAKRFLDIGFTMSFSGVITFSHDYDDVVRYVPLDMMHAETDSPYATPAPFRGERNNSMYVQEVVAKIATLRQENMEDVRVQLLDNARRMFGV